MTCRWMSLIACLLTLAYCLSGSPGLCTSAQIELSEPILTMDDQAVHGTAFFGWTLGSDLYNTAGDLGATLPLGHTENGKPYFFGDMFTWIRNPSGDEFQPRRIIYTLEAGYYWEPEEDIGLRAFVKHQSFHDEDMYDCMDESYELYGVTYRKKGPPDYFGRIGLYLNKRGVDYQWDIAAAATFPLSPVWNKETYIHFWLHQVTEHGNPTGRGGFLDYAAEAGIIFDTGVVLFTRYEYLHDINCFNGDSDHHFLTGVAYHW